MADISWTIIHNKILEYILLLVCLRYLLVDICGVVQYRAHGQVVSKAWRTGLVSFGALKRNKSSQSFPLSMIHNCCIPLVAHPGSTPATLPPSKTTHPMLMSHSPPRSPPTGPSTAACHNEQPTEEEDPSTIAGGEGTACRKLEIRLAKDATLALDRFETMGCKIVNRDEEVNAALDLASRACQLLQNHPMASVHAAILLHRRPAFTRHWGNIPMR